MGVRGGVIRRGVDSGVVVGPMAPERGGRG